MKLLIVNDAVLEAETMKREVNWNDYGVDQVELAFNADQGKKVVESQKVDILLCDIEMPGDNGIVFIRWLKDHAYDIDCILLTCHADFSYAREAVTLGCQDYLLLPAKYEEIGEVVLRVVKRRRKRMENIHLQELGQNWINSKAEEIDTAPVKTPKMYVEECQGYILDNIGDENLNISEITSNMHLSPTYLNRIFKKETGISINQWILKERMELAEMLMKTTNHSALTIAEQVGYLNYPYFSTVFKKYSGMTPAQFIKSVRENDE